MTEEERKIADYVHEILDVFDMCYKAQEEHFHRRHAALSSQGGVEAKEYGERLQSILDVNLRCYFDGIASSLFANLCIKFGMSMDMASCLGREEMEKRKREGAKITLATHPLKIVKHKERNRKRK